MEEAQRTMLRRVAGEYGTPCYVYYADQIRQRYDELKSVFAGRFEVSYAVKANPNLALLRRMGKYVDYFDVSSIGEVDLSIASGVSASRMSFSGPAKRVQELERAVELGVGEFVCESVFEIETLNRIAIERGVRCSIVLRINPRRIPKGFGVNMAGKASQFGIDEEDIDAAIEQLPRYSNVSVVGLHIYSATNALSHESVSENFEIYIEVFSRLARLLPTPPQRLVFGSGFGIPYHPHQDPLDIHAVANRIVPQLDKLKADRLFRDAKFILEMGRWLVGPAGYLLLSVVAEKQSRGANIRLCDGGFNNHLAACGMMGTILRRNWRIYNLSGDKDRPLDKHLLVGPLCTTIDTLATDIELPAVRRGDVLAIESSGAYGLTASPTRFISHPTPREVLISDNPDTGRPETSLANI